MDGGRGRAGRGQGAEAAGSRGASSARRLLQRAVATHVGACIVECANPES